MSSNRKVDGKKLDGLQRAEAGDAIVFHDDGTVTGTVTFRCNWKDVLRLRPKRNQFRHPDFTFMVCTGSMAKKAKGGIAEITATFKGGDESNGNDPTRPDAPQISAHSITSEEPIETSPYFEDMAGTPENPLWPGVYKQNDDGGYTFNEFPAKSESGEECPHFGVTSYMASHKIVRRSSISKSAPSSIPNMPVRESPPKYAGSDDWLKVVYEIDQQGDVYVITEEWMAAKKGSEWNEVVYP